jgi:ATP-dependent Clp protease adaptor protein ClpS
MGVGPRGLSIKECERAMSGTSKPHSHGANGTSMRSRHLSKPPRYRVLLHRDDRTSREFLVALLMEIFHKPEPDAVRVMMDVHQAGKGVAGVYPYEIAETKIADAEGLARRQGLNLRATLEAVES